MVWPKAFMALVERMLLGIRVQPTEYVGCCCFLEFDGHYQAQEVIPVLFNDTLTDVIVRRYFPFRLVCIFAGLKDKE